MTEEEVMYAEAEDMIGVPQSGILNDGLLQQLFRIKSHERRTGIVVAVVSAHRGAGTSQVTESLANQLGADNGGNIIALDARALDEVKNSARKRPQMDVVPAGYRMGPLAHWQDGYSFRASILHQLRSHYQYVLIDCPSLQESQEVLNLAPLVDGVIVVVEANRTRKAQIAFMERTITDARGHILGHVLNKRTYAIPAWLFRRLEA
jgi:Mrp family chromosome partitioning ATPase